MVQLEPDAKLPVQVVVLANGEVVTILVIERLRVPVLVNVTTCAGLVVLTVTLPKLRVEADRFTTGAPVFHPPWPPPPVWPEVFCPQAETVIRNAITMYADFAIGRCRRLRAIPDRLR